jgi:hypothetical protein
MYKPSRGPGGPCTPSPLPCRWSGGRAAARGGGRGGVWRRRIGRARSLGLTRTPARRPGHSVVWASCVCVCVCVCVCGGLRLGSSLWRRPRWQGPTKCVPLRRVPESGGAGARGAGARRIGRIRTRTDSVLRPPARRPGQSEPGTVGGVGDDSESPAATRSFPLQLGPPDRSCHARMSW